jgi:hypothetical protein
MLYDQHKEVYKFSSNQPKHSSIHTLQSALAPMSSKTLVNKLPKLIINNGRIIPIKKGVAELIGESKEVSKL